MDETEIVQQARDQHGLVTRQQALELGITRRVIDRRLLTGQWERTFDGVYIVGGAPPTWHQRVLAACLAAGSDAQASHRTSARLLGAVDRSGPIELLTDGYRRVRLPGVVVHRTIHLAPQDRVTVNGIPSSSLERTLIDLSPTQSAATLGRWVDAGVLRGHLDLASLGRRATELTMPGRPIPRSLMRALALRDPGHDPGRSALEARIVAALAARGIPPPVRQHEVLRPDGRTAFIDLSYPPCMVALEADGWATHGIREAFEPDRIRGNELALLGWTLYRFTWMMSDDYICDTVEAAITDHRGA